MFETSSGAAPPPPQAPLCHFTPSGVFSVKGTKEVAYAVFNALTDPANGGYARIRRTSRRTAELETGAQPTPDWSELR